MGLFWNYYKFGGKCHICRLLEKKPKQFKQHISKHFKKGFFDSEQQKTEFIVKNAHRIIISYKEKKFNFQQLLKELGIKEKPQNNTNCFFCKSKFKIISNKLICAECHQSIQSETSKEYSIFIDGKIYKNDHVNDLIIQVINKLQNEDQKTINFFKTTNKTIIGQTKLENFLLN